MLLIFVSEFCAAKRNHDLLASWKGYTNTLISPTKRSEVIGIFFSESIIYFGCFQWFTNKITDQKVTRMTLRLTKIKNQKCARTASENR